MSLPVDITFDCLPLRSIDRLDIPLDASAEYQARCRRIKGAIETHGSHNSYYLVNGQCAFHLTNDPAIGLVAFRFEGVVLTDTQDLRMRQAELQVELTGETCDGLSKAVADWLGEAVERAVIVEFDRYIAAGDLTRAHERLARIQSQCNDARGYLGMYL